MAEKTVVKKSFIGGRLRYPGEVVDVGAKLPASVGIAPSTPIGNLSIEQLQAAIAAAQAKDPKKGDAAPQFGANLADAAPTNTGAAAMPIADIAPRSPGSKRPQGLPPGGEQTIGGNYVFPAAEDADHAIQHAVAPGAEAGFGSVHAAATDKPQLDRDKDGAAGGSLKKAEIAAELDKRGVSYDPKATRDELAALLAKDDADKAGAQ